jgi:microcystin-dependent protein
MAEEYLGAIKIFAGSYAIKGFALCQGQTMSIQQNTALFSLLGITFGGNGVNNFMLPNLQSRLPIGQGNGQGLTPRVIGEMAGLENVTLIATTTPPHNHVFNASTSIGNTNVPGPTVLAGTTATTDGTFYADPNQTNFTRELMNAQAVSPQGGNLPHNNIQPSMGINYQIALVGIYPSRN